MNGAPLRARYVGYTTGTENHGDEALLWIIRELLAPEIEVVTAPGPCDLALLGGGTLLNQSPWLIDEFAAALDQARCGAVLGTGVGDLFFWGNHFARWRPLLERCRWIGVRGPDSLALLQQHDIERAELIGDPYLWLHAPVKREPIPRLLGVNLGCTHEALWGGDDADLLAQVGAALRSLRDRGWRFAWFSVWSKDLPLLDGVRRAVDAAGPLYDVRAQPLEAYAALAGCALFLGEKLHANAMAAVAGVPFLALEYQPKVRDFAASIDMGAWVVSTAERDPQALARRLLALEAARDAVRARMIAARNRARARIEAFAARIRAECRR